MPADTIFAMSSGRPPAAISVIRVSGPLAHEAGIRIAGALPEPRTAAVRELHHPLSGELLDEALVLRFDSPSSSTGENVVEFQCHGGRAVVKAVVDALASLDGLRVAQPGEFTRRAFDNGRIDLTEAEGLADLIEAETESQRKAALALAEGGLRKQLAEWQVQLLALSAEAERAIDYDEDDEGLSPALPSACLALAAELRSWLERPRAERLKEGVRVVVAGPPNSGKSSLINAIAGEDRAIVTDIPGTTRDYLELPLSLDGIPIVLTDTAGLRESADRVESIGVARARNLVDSADVLLWLGAIGELPEHPRSICVHTKVDLRERALPPEGAVPISAVTGEGVRNLIHHITMCAESVLPLDGTVVLNRRQAECVSDAELALTQASHSNEVVLVAEHLRVARLAFDRMTGRSGVEDVLDALFARFCLGK